MDPAGDIIQVNPSVGSRDTVPSTLGIGSIFNIPHKDVPIRSRWLPQLFATAKIYHVGAADAVMASITVPLGENSGGQASTGAIPPIVTRVGKEVDTFVGGRDDVEGGLGVGGEPLLV